MIHAGTDCKCYLLGSPEFFNSVQYRWPLSRSSRLQYSGGPIWNMILKGYISSTLSSAFVRISIPLLWHAKLESLWHNSTSCKETLLLLQEMKLKFHINFAFLILETLRGWVIQWSTSGLLYGDTKSHQSLWPSCPRGMDRKPKSQCANLKKVKMS